MASSSGIFDGATNVFDPSLDSSSDSDTPIKKTEQVSVGSQQDHAQRNGQPPTSTTPDSQRSSHTANTIQTMTESVDSKHAETADEKGVDSSSRQIPRSKDSKEPREDEAIVHSLKDKSSKDTVQDKPMGNKDKEHLEDFPVIGRISGFVSDSYPILHPQAALSRQSVSNGNAGEGSRARRREGEGLRQRSWGVTADYSMRTPDFYSSPGDGQEKMVVIGGLDEQFILTCKDQNGGDEGKLELEVKRSSTGGVVFLLLKLLYLYVTVFFCGFWIVCSVFLILQFVMGVVVTAFTVEPLVPLDMALALLSCFSFVLLIIMLAHFLTLVVGFVRDGWEGFDFLLTCDYRVAKAITNEWMIRLWLLLLPCLTLGIALFLESENPYIYPLFVALGFTGLLFLCYVFITMWIEFQLCMKLVVLDREARSKGSVHSTSEPHSQQQGNVDTASDEGIPASSSDEADAKGCCKTTICDRHVLADLVRLRLKDLFALTYPSIRADPCTYLWCQSCCCFSWRCCRCCTHTGCYEKLEEEEDMWRFEDFGKPRPVLDGSSTTVINTCCMRNRPIITNRDRIEQNDVNIMFGVTCLFLLGVCLLPAAYVGWLNFFGDNALYISLGIFTGLFIVVFAFCLLNYEKAVSEDGEDTAAGNTGVQNEISLCLQEDNTARFKVKARVDYTSVCSIVVIIVLCGLLFVIPSIRFVSEDMGGFLAFYFVLSILLVYRFIFNARAIMESQGLVALKRLKDSMRKEDDLTADKSRQVYLLLTRMLKPESVCMWGSVLGVFTAGFLFLALGALEDEPGSSDPVALYNGTTFDSRQYFVPPRDIALQYPACDLVKFNFLSSNANETGSFLLDLAFLSVLTYRNESVVQVSLDDWFGVGRAELRRLPDQFSAANIKSEARRIYVRDYDMEIITVRGTTVPIDALVDAQLWIGALGLQILRSLLPLGFLWNPILPFLDEFMGELQPKSSLNYFSNVRGIVTYLKSQHINNIMLTGHSLGGGVSMLVGAAERVPGVAISGPNAKISHRKHKIVSEDLDKYTLNVIPEYDIFPMVDDPALLVQNVLCNAQRKDGALACHSSLRTACEIMYACGSGKRPPLDCSGYFPNATVELVNPNE